MENGVIRLLEEYTKFYQEHPPVLARHGEIYATMRCGAQVLFWLRAAKLMETLEQKAREDKL